MKKQVAWVAVLLALSIWAPPSSACSCVSTAAVGQVDALPSGDAVFVGEVVASAIVRVDTRSGEPLSTKDPVSESLAWPVRISVLKVKEVWQGPVLAFATVITEASGASCGVAFDPGGSYLVIALWNTETAYAKLTGGSRSLYTDICMSTGTEESSAPLLERLRASQDPVRPIWSE